MVDQVFISHTSRDNAAASSLAERLEENGIGTWLDSTVFDEWATTRPERSSLNRELEKVLAGCDAFIVFVSAEPVPWQDQEVGAAMRRTWESDDFRMVPIARSDVSLPGALAHYQAVRMTDDPSDPAWQQEVVRALGTDTETDPAKWSDVDRSNYRRRLEKISKIAKDDEASQQATGSRTWPPSQ